MDNIKPEITPKYGVSPITDEQYYIKEIQHLKDKIAKLKEEIKIKDNSISKLLEKLDVLKFIINSKEG